MKQILLATLLALPIATPATGQTSGATFGIKLRVTDDRSVRAQNLNQRGSHKPLTEKQRRTLRRTPAPTVHISYQ